VFLGSTGRIKVQVLKEVEQRRKLKFDEEFKFQGNRGKKRTDKTKKQHNTFAGASTNA
jgi:hypothetical protein